MDELSGRLHSLTIDELHSLRHEVEEEIARRTGQARDAAKRWERCLACNGTGKLPGGYCPCAMGEDLRRIEVGQYYTYDADPSAR